MNLNDLISKLRTIEEGNEIAPVHTDGPAKEEGIEVIGGPMGMMGGMGHSEPPKQQDNVDMNITLHGAGAGGVRDLMNILHNIEAGNTDADHGDEHDHQEPIMGDMIDAMAHEQQVGEVIDADDGETWANSAYGDSGHHTHGIDSITMHGDDMNSKGGHEPSKKQGGGNPYNESLVQRLSAMYEEIKGEPLEEAKEKTMSRAAKGNEKYGKDGMKALAKAGREGKDLDKIRDKYDKYDESVSQMLALNKVLNG